jgi:hypothetical protein
MDRSNRNEGGTKAVLRKLGKKKKKKKSKSTYPQTTTQLTMPHKLLKIVSIPSNNENILNKINNNN